jgi:hypothetical protein
MGRLRNLRARAFPKFAFVCLLIQPPVKVGLPIVGTTVPCPEWMAGTVSRRPVQAMQAQPVRRRRLWYIDGSDCTWSVVCEDSVD